MEEKMMEQKSFNETTIDVGKENAPLDTTDKTEIADAPILLYMGHASLRIVTEEGKVIYIDPFAGEGYDRPADLILMTHSHFDHTDTDKIREKNDGCKIITWEEALKDGTHQAFDLGYINVESVEAGYNKNHNVKECVGYILTFGNEKTLYISGDTSATKQMQQLASRNLDYAFFCCDGIYNMDVAEATLCAKTVRAKHNIPYHAASAATGELFNREAAEAFDAPGKLILEAGQELSLK